MQHSHGAFRLPSIYICIFDYHHILNWIKHIRRCNVCCEAISFRNVGSFCAQICIDSMPNRSKDPSRVTFLSFVRNVEIILKYRIQSFVYVFASVNWRVSKIRCKMDFFVFSLCLFMLSIKLSSLKSINVDSILKCKNIFVYCYDRNVAFERIEFTGWRSIILSWVS